MTKQLQKKFAAFIVLGMMFSATTQAQWAASGTNIYNTNTGKVGIGTSTTTVPSGMLTVKGAGSVPAATWVAAGAPLFTGFGETAVGNADYILAMASTSNNGRPVFVGRRSRGTLAAPTVLANNDFIMSMLASGYDGTAFQNPSTIDFYVDGVPSAGNIPTRISFVTGSNSGNRAERLKIGNTGDISFNNTQLTLAKASGDLTLGAGNFYMGSGAKSIQFATPLVSGPSMMSMFPSGTLNLDRMVIAHSTSYPNWGLQYQDSLDKFNFLSGGTPVLTADLGAQRVGIYNSSPGARLDIAGSGTYDLSGSYADFRLGDAAYNIMMGVATGGGGAGDAYIASRSRLYLGSSSSYANTRTMALNPDGTVGIGSYLTSAKLGVTGDVASTQPNISATTSFVGNNDVRGIQSVSKASDGYGFGIHATGGYMGGYFIGDAGAYSGIGYGVYGNAFGSAGTRIGVYGTASGGTTNWAGYFENKTYISELRVGGTTGATGYIAAINGKLIATEVRVQPQANWPDYVFGKDHTLLSLEELEASINANKHLPGIPSDSEVKEGGIMLGEMQTKQMEKIEELTLYVIELGKQNKELKNEIEVLKTLVNSKK